MTTLDDLVAIASVGTSRKQVSLGGADGALGVALGAVEKQTSAEAKLLGAVAVLSRYEACGHVPAAAGDPGEPAAAEALAACSRRAGDLLGQILAMTNTPTKDQLLGEWLAHASRAGRRAPWRSLPALLDYGAAHRARRAAITDAAGARGAWLMRQNPRWQYAATEQDDPRSLWATGTRGQRIAALGRVRQSDPAAARELIQSTWAEDAAEERVAFVAAMGTSLSDADEALLESALDDRSKQVRAAAAELLARLPKSGLVRRMVERAETLVAFKSAGKGGKPVIEITLPADKFDAAWARDGVVEKPEGKMGRRQWWLMQVVGAIPPSHWLAKWGLSPQECLAAARGEFADVLIEGWHTAAGRNPEPAWLAALLLAAVKEERGPLMLSLLGHLPDDPREAITAEILESKKGGIEQTIAVLREGTFPLGRHAAAALFARVERHVAQQKSGYDYAVGQVLQDAACRVPPEFHDELAGRWTGERWEQNRKARDEFLQILQLRRDMKREFEAAE